MTRTMGSSQGPEMNLQISFSHAVQEVPATLQTEARPLFALVHVFVSMHASPASFDTWPGGACGTTQKPSWQTRLRKDGFASQSALVMHWVGSAVLRMSEHPAASIATRAAAMRVCCTSEPDGEDCARALDADLRGVGFGFEREVERDAAGDESEARQDVRRERQAAHEASLAIQIRFRFFR